jgi:nucleoside-diphosphate-sugar epimerase
MTVTTPKVLVTGATGNVGREAVDVPLDAGEKVGCHDGARPDRQDP